MSEPKAHSKGKPKYTLAELLAASDYSAPQSPEDREWIDAKPVGREIGSGEYEDDEPPQEYEEYAPERRGVKAGRRTPR